MKEINHELPVMPPPWCGSICRNAMSDVCVGHCAVKRDCSFFDPNKNLKLGDMPRFPETKDMTREEKFTSVTIYLAKVVDHLQGVEDEYPKPVRRSDLYGARSRSLPENFKSKDLLSHFEKTIPSLAVGEERESKGVGPSEVAGTDD